MAVRITDPIGWTTKTVVALRLTDPIGRTSKATKTTFETSRRIPERLSLPVGRSRTVVPGRVTATADGC